MENQTPISKPENAAPTEDVVVVDVPPLVSRSLVTEQFRRYEIARERQHLCEKNRHDGTFGIAVHKDDLALEWQGYARDVEESRAFLENRRPIPECWGESSSANAELTHPEPKP